MDLLELPEAARAIRAGYPTLKQWSDPVSGRNKLRGRITDVRFEDLAAEVTLYVGASS